MIKMNTVLFCQAVFIILLQCLLWRWQQCTLWIKHEVEFKPRTRLPVTQPVQQAQRGQACLEHTIAPLIINIFF